MSVRRVGQWNRARMLTSNLKNEIDSANTTALKKIGLKAERLIVKYIQKQPSVWPELSSQYKKRKVSQGYSDKKLMRTGDMFNRITSYADEEQAFAGVKKNAVGKDGEKLAKIAAIMEFGSKKRNIPPRPFLSPVQRLISRKIREENMFQKYLMLSLKQKYGV